MNINEICVPIRNEAELQKAREILERNGEKIDEKCFRTTDFDDFLKCSKYDNEWYLGNNDERTEIPLSELEAVLRGESESKKQSSIEWLVSLLKTDEEKEQAKQMHREEIEQAYCDGYDNVNTIGSYYDKTFKND